MRRRDFIAATAGAAAGWPLAVSAQAPAKKPQIAVLMLVAENDRDSQARITALRDGLAALGWIDGTTATIEYRWASADNAQVERY
ncbi:MAG TPA: hypothetical protein VKU84_00300, partial [Stellaceae bacterium]|nr:hypothetical protein [Stellaceae bacterium]